MSILNKVTIQNLKKNKVRTLVTIIGIILSVAMFTAVTTSLSSFQNYLVRVVENSTGSWHGVAQGVTSDKISIAQKDDDIETTVSLQNIGYAKISSKNSSKPYLFVAGISKNYTDLVPVIMDKGRMPKTTDEILIPNHLKTNGGVKYSIGDKLSLSIGNRYIDGKILNPQNEYYENETLKTTAKKTYTVVGFYERPDYESYVSPGFTALTVQDTSMANNYDVFLKANNMRNIYDIVNKDFKGSNVSYNTDLLRFNGASNENNYNSVLYAFGGILIVIIMLGSVSLIYNAFSISVSERTKQFGLLKSIGATKRQIMRSVLFEAFALSIIGVPLGLLAGIVGIGITLTCTRNMFVSFVTTGSDVTLGLHLSWESILIAIAIGVITVLISAFIPAKKAVRKSAIESIRQSNDIKIKAKKVKTSKLTLKLFGFEGMISSKNFKRNRKKYRATVISLFMSILLFMTASTFSAYLNGATNSVISNINFDIAYDYYIDDDNITGQQKLAQTREAFDLIKNTDGVSRSSFVSMTSPINDTFVDNSLLTDEYIENNSSIQGSNKDKTFMQPYIIFISDQVFSKYVKDNNLDQSKYLNYKKPVALLGNNMTSYKSEAKKYVNYDVFSDENFTLNVSLFKKINGYNLKFNDNAEENDTDYIYKSENGNKIINADKSKVITKALQVGDTISKVPLGTDNIMGSGACIIYPQSAMTSIYSDADEYFNMQNDMFFVAKNHKAVCNRMANVLENKGYDTSNLVDITENMEATKAIMLVVDIFTFGFIALISLIAVANVFNTISTNVSLRRREFAMLKSVGMTTKGFNKMMNYECLLYGIKSLLYGLPVSLIVSYLLFKALQGGLEMQAIFPWQSMIVAIISVFAVVFATMIYSMRKIKKDNPIDALKNENL